VILIRLDPQIFNCPVDMQICHYDVFYQCLASDTERQSRHSTYCRIVAVLNVSANVANIYTVTSIFAACISAYYSIDMYCRNFTFFFNVLYSLYDLVIICTVSNDTLIVI